MSLSSSPPQSAPRPPSSSSSPSSSILHLYAELLLHIRTVTFVASLRTDHTEQTRAELSADGESITLTHEGERASIRLPTRVVGGGSAALTLPASPAKELSLRLQLKERSSGGLLKGGAGGGENVVPWDAGRLAECGRVECRGCGREIVKVGKNGDDGAEDAEAKADEAGYSEDAAPSEQRGVGVKKWMDLPNENWAEMMDFWHCHKPHEHHLPGHTHGRDGIGKEKGYAASNRITAKRGVGYVDLAYLLLAEEDCLGVQPSKPTSPSGSAAERQQLTCSYCKTIVGVTDARAEGWRIWKWSFAATRKDSTNTKTYSLRKWVAAQLLYLIENQAVRKFTVTAESSVRPGEEVEGGSEVVAARDPIMIWVFTPDLSFSSSATSSDDDSSHHRNDPTRAMKVLWKPAPAQNGGSAVSVAAGQALDRQSLSTEDLSLPRPAFDALMGGLKESGRWLPASARAFQEWNVGLLERFGDYEVQ